MKSLELQPTYENFLNTYLNDSIGRNEDLHLFISILNALEDNCSIALEGRWGSGKTFFVKQVKLILDSLNDFITSKNPQDTQKIKACWDKYKDAEDIDYELEPQVCIYFDSWANDNDDDPILSLVLEIIKSINTDYDFKTYNSLVNNASGILEFFTGKKVKELIDIFKGKDPLSQLKMNKDIHTLVNDFLESLLYEKGNRLIIFIDELDRCKPSYTVKLLERIKHYFSNQKITFVFSTNLEELQHTVKHYYGNEFNSCRYLDRFFDLRISLPKANLDKYYESIAFNKSYYKYNKISHAVVKYYNFELREIAKFLRLTRLAYNTNDKHNFSFSDEQAIQFCILCIVPIMIGLKISDLTSYRDFIEGDDPSPLIEILKNGKLGIGVCNSLLNANESYDASEGGKKTIVKLEDKLNNVYAALFKKKDSDHYNINIGNLSFDSDTNKIIMRVASMLSVFTCYDNQL